MPVTAHGGCRKAITEPALTAKAFALPGK